MVIWVRMVVLNTEVADPNVPIRRKMILPSVVKYERVVDEVPGGNTGEYGAGPTGEPATFPANASYPDAILYPAQ